MIKKKKLIAVIMLAVIIIGTPLVEYKRAEASTIAMPLILKGVGGTIAGMSVGGAICLLISTVAIAYGISWVIDNADDIARRFDRWANSKNDTTSKLLLQEIKQNAYSISDNSSIPSYYQIPNYFDYVTSKSNVTFTPTVKNSIKNFIEESTGANDLSPGTYNNNIGQAVIDKVNTILGDKKIGSQYGPWQDIIMQATNAYEYTFIVDVFSSGWYYYYIMCTNELPNISIVNSLPTITFKNRLELSVVYYSGESQYRFYNNGEKTNTASYTAYSSTFSNVDLLFTNENGDVVLDLISAVNPPVTINESKVKINIPTEEFMSQTNTVEINNPYLQEVMDGVDANGIPLETIMALVGEAEKEAAKENDIVTDIPIEVPVNPDIPGETDIETTLPGILGDWLDKLITKLKEMLEWLFVPDAVALENIVDNMKQELSNQMGVLTYPLALVIRFLTEFLRLESEECIITLPEIRMPGGYILYEGYDFNFTNYITQAGFTGYYNLYLMIVRTILILQFLSYAIKKGDEVFKGGIAHDS